MMHSYKNLILTCLLALLSLPCFSQKGFQADKPNAFLSMARPNTCKACYAKYYKYVSKLMESKFTYSRNHVLKIIPVLRKEGAGIIEGMESVQLDKVTFELVVNNRLTQEKDRWERTFDLKTSSGEEGLAVEEVTNRLLTDSLTEKDIMAFLDNYMQKEFFDKCQKYLKAAEAKRQKGEFNKAITILSYIHEKSECAQEKNQRIKTYLEERTANVCQNQMQKAKILSNSPDLNDVRKAINILLSISPEAPCAQEAIDLSNNIGARDFGSRESEKLKQQIMIWQNQSSEDWYHRMFEKTIH